MLGKLTKWISDSFTQWLTYDHPYEGIPLCDFERIRYELRPCDVLLIEGRSRVSEIIRTITQSSWSHSALYIGRLHDIQDPKIRNLVSAHFKGPPDTQLLVEGIMGKGGLVSDIMSYKNDHIRLCRPRGLSRQDAQQVIAYAIRKLGHEYDVRHVFDLARFLLPWTLFPRRFRSKLFEYHPGDSTKTVCSTLIAEAFNHVEFPILPLIKRHATKGLELITRNPKLYTPRDFDYSPYFEIIKYPFVEFVDYAMYRQLPWNREGLISHDRMGVREAHSFEIDKKNKEKMNSTEIDELNELAFEHLLPEDSVKDKEPENDERKGLTNSLSSESADSKREVLQLKDKFGFNLTKNRLTRKFFNRLEEKTPIEKENLEILDEAVINHSTNRVQPGNHVQSETETMVTEYQKTQQADWDLNPKSNLTSNPTKEENLLKIKKNHENSNHNDRNKNKELDNNTDKDRNKDRDRDKDIKAQEPPKIPTTPSAPQS